MEPSSLQNPNPHSDLLATISLLQSLSSLAESTISSVSSFLQNPNPNPNLLSCPHDPRHRTPPESLFRHSLLCPAAPAGPLPDLLQTLKPNSQTLTHNSTTNNFTHQLSDPDDDLCFSLDCHVSNFFYRGCPGVVATPDPDDADHIFTLPMILSRECANFITEGTEYAALEGGEVTILPSELWAVKREVGSWGDFPGSYSWSVIRVCSGLSRVEERELKRWVISESLRFGIVIDESLRDHLFLLLKLCCRAVRREAVCILKPPRSENVVCNFECPKLVRSFMWLASQLSILYGEVNGRFFALGMLKESVLRAGSSLVLDLCGSSLVLDLCGSRQSSGRLEVGTTSEDCDGGEIFVSQVAAAVAALHERFLLEQIIKALRHANQLSKSQRLNEYLYASTRACELRGKRPNYRPVLEHDGLPWQRVNNQDSGRVRTREEMLAEERDYKRRRMSYRGKKVKRNPTEVLRDIIEEHMEEIKVAGGIGCNVKVADTVLSSCRNNSRSGNSTNVKPQNIILDASETGRDPHGYGKPLHSEYNFTSRKDGDPYSNDDGSRTVHTSHDPQVRQRREHSERRKDHKKNRYSSKKNYVSGYASVRSDAHPHDWYDRSDHLDRHAHQNGQSDRDMHRTEYDKKGLSGSLRYRGDESRSEFTSMTTREVSKEEKSFISKSRSRKKGSVSESFWSESASLDGFEDRYDPSRSYDRYDATSDDVSIGGSHLRSDRDDGAANVTKYNDEQPRHVYDSKNHKRYHYK